MLVTNSIYIKILLYGTSICSATLPFNAWTFYRAHPPPGILQSIEFVILPIRRLGRRPPLPPEPPPLPPPPPPPPPPYPLPEPQLSPRRFPPTRFSCLKGAKSVVKLEQTNPLK